MTYEEEKSGDFKDGSRRSRSRSRDRQGSSFASADPEATCALKMKGLPWSAEEADVYEFFEGHPIVNDSVKLGVYEDGRKSGNACVLFESPDAAAKAKSEKEGEKIGHRWINLIQVRCSEHETYLDTPEIKPERPPPPTESDVLFCGNVGDESTVDSITEFFDKAGGVTQVRRPEGRPFAFIEFESMDACAKALEELQDQELDGQVPRLALAQPKGSRRGGAGRPVITESDTCFIGNIAGGTEEEDLEELLCDYDYVEIRLPPGKGFAFVTFDSNDGAKKAMTDLNGKECNGNALRFDLAKPKNSGDDGPPLEDTKGLSSYLDEDNVDRAVKLRGLPFKTTVASILSFVKDNSEGLEYLEEKHVVQEVKDGKATGFALLFLKDDEDAEKALDLDHKEIGTRWVGVSAAEMR